MTIVKTDFTLAFDAWSETTINLLREAFLLENALMSDEVVATEVKQAMDAVVARLRDTIGAQQQMVIDHATIGLRALGGFLEKVADAVEDESPEEGATP